MKGHRVDLTVPCRPTKAALNSSGYGVVGIVRDGRKTTQCAHAAVWERAYGPIPSGMNIDHACHNPDICRLGDKCPHRACEELAHLQLLSQAENVRRAYSPNGEKTHCVNGHELNGDNVHIRKEGWRVCKRCRADRQKRYNETKVGK